RIIAGGHLVCRCRVSRHQPRGGCPLRRTESRHSFWRRILMAFPWSMVKANRLALTGGVILAFFAVAALIAPWLAPRDPYEIVPASMLATPGAEHWLGADQLGRDLFSRMVYGSRISFHVGLVAVGIALTVGTLLGVAAGYLGGWVDAVISRFV